MPIELDSQEKIIILGDNNGNHCALLSFSNKKKKKNMSQRLSNLSSVSFFLDESWTLILLVSKL